MSKFDQFKAKLRPGQTFRRADLAQWSTAVDRHLKEAVQADALTKLAGGLYYAPKQTAFGKAPPEDDTLLSTFLKGGPFLLASPNAYNALGVGTTQLHNKTVVYNHKRHGKFALGGRTYDFRMKPAFPKKLSREFLLVDLVNNLDHLGESADEVLERVKSRLAASDRERVKKAAQTYGSERAKTFFIRALAEIDAEAKAQDGA
jgi:hypothetical protein